ncbi:uncharacterized protein METZ01_LOCUS7487 [marine metagenome]|uniref:Uncharacterized protein n=1 Tax=marine metagenome TaxID=408172 RepID=A0A381NM74_9ZZZZ
MYLTDIVIFQQIEALNIHCYSSSAEPDRFLFAGRTYRKQWFEPVVVNHRRKRNNDTRGCQGPSKKRYIYTYRSKREFWKEQTDSSHGANCCAGGISPMTQSVNSVLSREKR